MFNAFPVIAGGLLPAAATSGQKSQTVSGCTATRTATAGKWDIDLDVGPIDVRKHLVVAYPCPGLSLTAGHGFQILPLLTTNGFSLSFQDGNAGSYAAADKAMQFFVVERPGS